MEIEWTFTAYFTAKNDSFKKGTILTFNRLLSYHYTNERDGYDDENGSEFFEEGLHNDDGSGFTRTGGDDEPVAR